MPTTPKTASLIILAIAGLTADRSAHATIYAEVEDNESKAAATVVNNLVSGDALTGSTTGALTTPGATSVDYFKLTTATTAPGIYKQQLALTTGFAGTIRGLNQNAGVIGTTDTNIQTASAGLSQFYTFGDPSSLYYAVTGTAATTSPYTVALTTTTITPQVVASPFQTGTITISTAGQTTADTDFWIYDANFNAIPGYGRDDNSNSIIQGTLTRTYAPGTYYVAIGTFNLANNQASPADDAYRAGNVLDFPGVVLSDNAGASENTSFLITDGFGGSQLATVTKVAAFDVNFVQFTVVPEPAGATLLGLGTLLLAARRRRNA